MTIAYFISLYKTPRQFAWLWSALYNEEDCFVIHLDSRADAATKAEVERIVAERPNARFLPSIPTAWGGWSLCQIELDAIALFCRWRTDWSFFVNLSGQDYPIKPAGEIRSFLARHPGSSFVDVRPVDVEPWHIRRRPYIMTVEWRGAARRLPLPVLMPRHPVPRWFGSGWHILERAFCDWLVSAPITQRVKRRLRHTHVPSENFIQLLIMSGPFRNRWIGEDKRFALFEHGSPNHKILTASDLTGLRTSPALFARKFDETVDDRVLRGLAALTNSPVPDHARPAKTTPSSLDSPES